MSITSTKTCIIMHLSKVMFGFECSSITLTLSMFYGYDGHDCNLSVASFDDHF